jgi:hypothetical protein
VNSWVKGKGKGAETVPYQTVTLHSSCSTEFANPIADDSVASSSKKRAISISTDSENEDADFTPPPPKKVFQRMF